MKCPNCHAENLADSAFCEECSAPLEAACPTCGADNRPTAKFCRKCRAPLTSAPAAAPAPRGYTPKHLAEKILQSRSALEGERKQVTVLFADVKGSMELAEHMDPEAWSAIMQRFFRILSDGVERFEGFVDKFTGDGIMALFGAPIAHEDHTQRACYAALHAMSGLRTYAREIKREHGIEFWVRMGVNSGDVVVGKIGDDLRMDYTAQGHTVGLAARMESLAEPGKAYLTGKTAERVKGYFELEDLGAFNVKGVSDPVPVFELLGVGSLRTRFDVSRSRGLTRFVGRDADMQVLESALASAKQGKGRAIGIVANAGVGKSRLCFEFTERCRATGIVVLQGSGVAHGKNIPLLPILEIFRAYFGVDERDDPRQVREKIAGRLLLIDDSFREVLPLVFDFLGVPDAERPSPPMDAEARQRRLVAVVRRLIERGNPNGFVVLIEDLHWVDVASDAFVAEYVDAIANGPGLLLLNFRPEYRAEWMQKTWYQQLPLNPLGPEAIRQLLDDLLGKDASIQGLADRIHERTEGNPYFTEEIVRSLVDSGALKGTRGAYRLTSPVEALEVPYSVHAVLSARIDRLAEREKQVLQKAAVVGKQFAEPILGAVVELPAAELASSLAALCNAEFIHQQSLYPIAEYAFAHPLTQEVALGSQLQEQRRKTHAAVAQAIRAAEPERLNENAALLAHHYEEAGEVLEAARCHASAATWVGTKDLDGTLRHWQRVRDLVRALPENEEANGLRLLACFQILSVGGFRLGLSEAAVDEIYEEGNQLAEHAGNPVVLVTMRAAYGARLVGLGRVREYYDLMMENLKGGDESGLRDARAGVRVAAAYASFLVGRLADSMAYVEQGLEITGNDLELGRREFGFSYRVFFVGVRAAQLGSTGRLDDSCREMKHALRVARDSRIPENLGWILGSVPGLADYAGQLAFEDLGDAKAAAMEALRIAEDLGSAFSRAAAYVNMAVAHLVAGEFGEAERFLADALELTRTRRISLEHEAFTLAHLARAQLGGGHAAAARNTAEEAVALAKERGQRFVELLGQIVLAEALCADQGARARTAVERALHEGAALVEETGGRVHVPRIAEARARLAQCTGDTGAGEQFLREAHRVYTAMGARGHAARVAKEMGY